MITFSSENDFLMIVDKCETLKWLRPQSDVEVTIANAVRMSDVSELQTNTSERETACWIFPKSLINNEIPFAGDILLDGNHHSWRIDDVEHRRRVGCWKCTATNLTLRHRLEERVEWYRPHWILNENGTSFPEYHLERPGIPARIVPIENGKFEIFFVSQDLNITYRDCFMTPDNRGFRVLEFYPAQSWSELSRAVTERIRL